MSSNAERAARRGGGPSVRRVGCDRDALRALVDEDLVIDPTGLRCRLRGVTIAEFDGDRIRSFRQYWDEVSLIEQFGLLPED
jgi:ketosteroid isomerase-like protein